MLILLKLSLLWYFKKDIAAQNYLLVMLTNIPRNVKLKHLKQTFLWLIAILFIFCFVKSPKCLFYNAPRSFMGPHSSIKRFVRETSDGSSKYYFTVCLDLYFASTQTIMFTISAAKKLQSITLDNKISHLNSIVRSVEILPLSWVRTQEVGRIFFTGVCFFRAFLEYNLQIYTDSSKRWG